MEYGMLYISFKMKYKTTNTTIAYLKVTKCREIILSAVISSLEDTIFSL